jgi:hypothetical protein
VISAACRRLDVADEGITQAKCVLVQRLTEGRGNYLAALAMKLNRLIEVLTTRNQHLYLNPEALGQVGD